MGNMIAGVSMMTWVAVIALIVLTTLKRMKKMPGNTANKNRSYSSAAQLYSSNKQSSSNSIKTTSRIKAQDSGEGMILRDDRNNDWLALQLKEEAKARVRMSEMFQMKIEHANKCDAEFIKRFHESSCDAEGIDYGIRK